MQKLFADLDHIEQEALQKIDFIENSANLGAFKIEILGKKSPMHNIMQQMAQLNHEEKRMLGAKINQVRNLFEQKIAEKSEIIANKELEERIKADKIDITLPYSQETPSGSAHIINKIIRRISEIMIFLGFEKADGPEIEEPWYNFDGLNVGEAHPARRPSDTFYIAETESSDTPLLLRTHTSNVQLRHLLRVAPNFLHSQARELQQHENHNERVKNMAENSGKFKKSSNNISQYVAEDLDNSDLAIFSIGKVYRPDSDATHTPMFHQLECLCIGSKINWSNLKYTINSFLSMLFKIDFENIIANNGANGKNSESEKPCSMEKTSALTIDNIDTPYFNYSQENSSNTSALRYRSSYFPFTEPSAELDLRYRKDPENGRIFLGEGDEWLEILGCGLVHPQVLRNVGLNLDPNLPEVQGFAFGVGIERLAMLMYQSIGGVGGDIRPFYEGDIRWLKQQAGLKI